MMLSYVVDGLTEDLQRAAAVGGDDVQRAAGFLLAALAPSLRLRLLEALEAAATELSASTPGVAVELRLVDGDPVLNLLATPPPDAPETPREPGAGEGESARITLRLPEELKRRIETAASGSGASVNSWLVQAAARALGGQGVVVTEAPRGRPRRITGFVRG